MNELPHDLLHACLLYGQGVLASFDLAARSEWMPDQGSLWIHFDLTSEASGKWLAEKSGLDPIAVESLLAVQSRPRVTRLREGALLAFRGVNLNEGATPDDMDGIRVWLDEHLVISTERRSLRSVGDVVGTLQTGEGPRSAPEVIAELVRRLVTRMSDTVDNLEETMADLEDQTLLLCNASPRHSQEDESRPHFAAANV